MFFLFVFLYFHNIKMSYGNYVQGSVDSTNNAYNLLVSGASSGYSTSALGIGGDTSTTYGVRMASDNMHNAYLDMRADQSNTMSFRYKDNATGSVSSMLQLANDTNLTGNGYGAIVQGRVNASSFYASGVDSRAPTVPGIYLSNDGNVAQVRMNKGNGTGGFAFATYNPNGTLMQSNLNLLASGMIQASYYSASRNGADFETVAAAGFDASGNIVRNYDLNNRLRTLEARVTVVEIADVPTLTTKMNEMIGRLNGLNFFSQRISTIPSIPNPPVNVVGTAVSQTSANVSFVPADILGNSFTVTSSPDGITATGTQSPILVTGLRHGITYTFSVSATGAIGTSNASTASTPITL